MATFDITRDLEPGTTLLEASAGTGKTWTIAALVTRTSPRATPPSTRCSWSPSAGPRARSCASACAPSSSRPSQVLDRPARAAAATNAAARPAPRHRRRTRARASACDGCATALAAFDAATIATIHQFCQLVLRSLGVAGDTDAGATLVEDLDELVGEVVDDLYLARFGDRGDAAVRRAPQALALARAGRSATRSAVLEPLTAWPTPGLAGGRAGRASRTTCCAEIERRKRRLGILGYDDLLSRLADALEDDDAPAREPDAAALADRAGRRVPGHRPRAVAGVLDRAFAGHATMVLIGDPKQAIYAFRGGDIVTYLAAADAAAHDRRRSASTGAATQPLVDALQAVLRGRRRWATSASWSTRSEAHHQESRLVGRRAAPFRLRVVRRAGARQGGRAPSRRSRCGASTSSPTSPPTSSGCSARGATFDGRPLAPGDVAVLAARRTRARGRPQQALLAVGVPSVIDAGGTRLPHPGRRRVAGAPRGAGAAAPLRPGARRGPHLVLRALRRRARRRRRRPDRPASPSASATLADVLTHPRGRGRARGGGRAPVSPPGCSAGSAASAP